MKKDKNTKFKKPNPLAWYIYSRYSRLKMFFSNKLKINRKEFNKRNKKEGCIVLYNHTSNRDHYITTSAFYNTKVIYVVSRHFYFTKILRILLDSVRAIPKEQFRSDISTIKKIKRALQYNYPVAIAPEGQTTMHGGEIPIDKSIVKLLRMCNVDVYGCLMHGSYLAYPKWRKFRRKLQIRIDFEKMFSKEELKSLSDDEIYDRICSTLRVDDRNEIEKYNYELKDKQLVDGLDGMIYLCPKCGNKYHINAKDRTVTCDVCHNTMIMNNQGAFLPENSNSITFNNEYQWYKYQFNSALEEVKKDGFVLTGKFDLYRNIKEPFVQEKIGTGILTLTKDILCYDGIVEQKEYHKDFKLETLSRLAFEVSRHFDISDDEGCFEFVVNEEEKPQKVVEFVITIDAIAKLREDYARND